MKRRAVGGNILPMTKSLLHFFSFGSSCKPTRRGKNNHLMTFARVFVVGVYLAGAQGENVQQSYKNGMEEERKKQDFALMGSQRVVLAGKPKSLFF